MLHKSHRNVVSTCVLIFMPYIKKKTIKNNFFFQTNTCCFFAKKKHDPQKTFFCISGYVTHDKVQKIVLYHSTAKRLCESIERIGENRVTSYTYPFESI